MAKKKATKKKTVTKKKSKDSNLTKLDETGLRQSSDRRKDEAPVAKERRKTQRRRQIDPTTCEREYKDNEIEFMHALDEYKRKSGRMFPTCSEILEVLEGLGYRKVENPAPIVAIDATAPMIDATQVN